MGIPLAQLDAVETWVREVCNDSIVPPLDALIQKLELPTLGGDFVPVIRIEVERSLFVHKSPGGYFRRIGSSKRELSPERLARLFQERSQTRMIRFDELLVPGTSGLRPDTAVSARRRSGRGCDRRCRAQAASRR